MRNLALCLAVAVGVAAAAWSEAAQAEMTLRYNSWLPKQHPTQIVIKEWAKEVAEVTNGRVQVEFTASSLGPPPAQYQLAADGVADITWALHGYTPGVFPLALMPELPFLTRSTEANSVAYWRVFKKYFEPAGMHSDVHTLTVHVHPAGQIFNNKRPIKSMDDFDGLKLRIPNQTSAKAIERFGGVPIQAPITKAYENLSRGVMDGITLTEEGVVQFNLVEFSQYELKVPGGFYNSSFFFVMNKAKWDQISAEDQEAITRISGETLARKMGKSFDKSTDEAQDVLKKGGVEVYEADGPLLEQIRAKMDDFDAGWIEEAETHGVDGAAALKMFREEVDAYGG